MAPSSTKSLPETIASWSQLVMLTLAKIEDCHPREILIKHQFRLLNWRVWCLRYSISLRFLIEALLHGFRSRRKAQRGNHRSLGLSIAALTGDQAQKIIEDAVARAYPQNENEELVRSHLQTQMLGYGPSVTLPPRLTREEIVTIYREKIMARRDARHSMQQKLSRRPWRGNPWR